MFNPSNFLGSLHLNRFADLALKSRAEYASDVRLNRWRA